METHGSTRHTTTRTVVSYGKQRGTDPVADDEVLLLLDEEGVEPVDLGVEQPQEGGLGGPPAPRRRRRHEQDQPLEALVRQELVPPLREARLHLLLQPLPKLHLLLISCLAHNALSWSGSCSTPTARS